MPPVVGVGSQIAATLLMDVSYALIEPVVQIITPAPGIAAGPQVVLAWDNSIYLGAQLVVGAPGANLEVVTVTAVTPGVSFAATFLNPHPAGSQIFGATFPVQQTATDPFWSQMQMLEFLATALQDFVVRVPLLYQVTTAVVFGPTVAVQPLPADCMKPVRVAAFGKGLRETSQSRLDLDDYRWANAGYQEPVAYYRDKIGIQNIGLWPAMANTTATEILYQQRGPQAIGLADGFPIPDPFLPTIKARVMQSAYAADSEQRNPALARFFGSRFDNGCKIASMFVEVVQDTSEQ